MITFISKLNWVLEIISNQFINSNDKKSWLKYLLIEVGDTRISSVSKFFIRVVGVKRTGHRGLWSSLQSFTLHRKVSVLKIFRKFVRIEFWIFIKRKNQTNTNTNSLTSLDILRIRIRISLFGLNDSNIRIFGWNSGNIRRGDPSKF